MKFKTKRRYNIYLSSQGILILISICNFAITENHFAKQLKEEMQRTNKNAIQETAFCAGQLAIALYLIRSILVSRNIKRVFVDLVFQGSERFLRKYYTDTIPCRKCALQYILAEIS